MKKISTLFKKNPENLGLVINEIDPFNTWVFDDCVSATRKFDGSACAIIGGELYKRYDAKNGKPAPDGAIPCQDPDFITGHWPHWVKCDRTKPEDKYFFEALDKIDAYDKVNGTYELCGPKIQGNPEKLKEHLLIRHGSYTYVDIDMSFESLKQFLSIMDIEGLVFHHEDGRMCKIRKSDFGIKR